MENEIAYINTRYDHSEKITHDFVTICYAFCYLKRLPLKAKLGWDSISETVRFCLKHIFKKSLTWSWYKSDNTPVNPVNPIGAWLWSHGVPYPSFLYSIFPPPFGKNHVFFMETMFSVLNNMDMPKSDWEMLLNWIDLIDTTDEMKQKYRDSIDAASNALWRAFNAEKYHRYVICSKKK